MTSVRRALGRAREHGAAAVEFAIGAMLLLTILFGAAEFGMLMQKEHTLASAVRSGARIASSPCLDMTNADAGDLADATSTAARFRCEKGNREIDDFFVLQGIRAALRGYWSDVEAIRLYRIPQGSIAKGDGKPPSVCETAMTGVTTWCNVYTNDVLFDDPDKGAIKLLSNLDQFYYDEADHVANPLHKVGQIDQDLVAGVFNCATGPSRFFCPTGKTPAGQPYRVRNLNSPSNLGVYVQLRHSYLTGLFGSGRNVQQWTSFRLEPHPLANDPIPPCPAPCTFEIPPNGETDLAVTKTVDKSIAMPGDFLNYTIIVQNKGPKQATARFVDEVPPILTLTGPWRCVASNGANCGLQDQGTSMVIDRDDLVLPAGGRVTYTYRGLLPNNAYDLLLGQPVLNTGTVTAQNIAEIPTSPDNNTDNAETVVALPEVNVHISGPATAAPGSTVEYIVDVTNNGQFDVDPVRVSDVLPASGTVLQNVTWTCESLGATCPSGGGSSTYDFGLPIAKGKAIRLRVSGTIPNTATQEFTVTANLSTNPIRNVGIETDSVTTTLERPDISVTKTDGQTATAAGATVDYTIMVTNKKSVPVFGARLKDTPGTSLTAVQWTCTRPPGSSATCPAASGAGAIDFDIDLPGNGTLQFVQRVNVSGTAGSTVTNTVKIDPPNGIVDEQTNDNIDSDTDSVALPNLTITKSETPISLTSVGPDQVYSYKITASNDNVTDLTGVTVQDTPPAALTAGAWSCAAFNGASCTSAGSGAINQTVDLPRNSRVEFTMSVTVNANSGSIVNMAKVFKTGMRESSGTDASGNVIDPGDNIARDTNTITNPDISVTKTDGVAVIGPNQSVTYTVVVTNPGPGPANNVSFSDSLPSDLTNISWSCSGSAGATCGSPTTGNTSGSISRTLVMPAGSTVTFTVTAKVVASPGSSTLVNTASASSSSDPNGANNTATDTDAIQNPDVQVTKTASVGTSPVGPGQTFTYTVVYTSNGPGPATGVVISDAEPAALSWSWTCTAAGSATCPAASGTGDISGTANFPVSGGTLTYAVTATVNTTATGTLTNTASLTLANDRVSTNNSASVTNTITPADVQVKKKVNPTTALGPGQTVTYTVTITNAGPGPATGVSFSDPLPTGIASWSWTCAGAGGATCPVASATTNTNPISFTGVTLPAPSGTTVKLTYTVTATTSTTLSGNIANVATATYPTDPTPGNNTKTVTNTTAMPDVAVTKTASTTAAVGPGQTITYTVKYMNNGPGVATGVAINDAKPTGIASWSWVCAATNGATCPTGHTTANTTTPISATVTLPAPSGTIPTLTYTVTAVVGTTGLPASIANTATATYASDPTTTNNTATVTNAVTQPDIAVTKTASPSTAVGPGQTITYTVGVSNNGPGAASGVVISDPVPTGLTYNSVSCAAVGGATCPAAWTSGALSATVNFPAKVSTTPKLTFTIVATVGTSSPPASVTNTATATFSSDPATANNTASVTNTITQPDVSVTKSVSPTSAVGPGQTITYTVVITNVGPGPAPSVSFSDTKPTGISSWSFTCAGTGVTCPTLTPGGPISFSNVNFPAAGNKLTYTVTATVASTSLPASIINSATVTSPSDPVSTNNTASVTNTTTAPDVSVTKSVSPTGIVGRGDSLTYTVVLRNNGPGTTTSASITDSMPTGIASWNWTCVGSGATCPTASGSSSVSETGITLAPSATLTYTFAATVSSTASTSITNTANVGSTGDPTTSNNAASVTNTVQLPDLTVTKTGPSTIGPFQTMTYTVTASNAGSGTVTGATVTDNVPGALSNVTWTCSASAGSSCPAASGTGSLSALVTLKAGGTATFLVSGVTSKTASGTISNSASIAPPLGVTESNSTNNTSATVVTTVVQPDLSIVKTRTSAAVYAGQQVTYSLVVTNNGAGWADSAVIADAASAKFNSGSVFWSCTASGGATCPAASGTGNLSMTASIPQGGVLSFVFNGTLSSLASGPLSNTGTVTARSGVTESNTGNNSSTVNDTITVPVTTTTTSTTTTTAPPVRGT